MRRSLLLCAVLAGLGGVIRTSSAAVIADFKVDKGLFASIPTASGTTNMLDKTLSSTELTSDALEGGQALKLNLVGNNTAIASPSFPRIRFLCNTGTPIAASSFSYTGSNDGYIGFYYKTSDFNLSGAKGSIYLDDSTNTAGGMNGAVAKAIVADGQWHVLEWNLDTASDWGSASGVGGVATISVGTHSVDSLFFRVDNAASPWNGSASLLVDFVAYNPKGSITQLVPEPASLGLGLLGGLGLLARRRR